MPILIDAEAFEKYAWNNPDIEVDGEPYVSPLAVKNFAMNNPVLQNKWIPISCHLPKPEEEVRLLCKSKYKTYQCQGFYIPENMNEEDSDFSWDWEMLEYDNEKDISYVHPGWYERIHNWDDFSAVSINDEVLYWMPLPDLPEDKA